VGKVIDHLGERWTHEVLGEVDFIWSHARTVAPGIEASQRIRSPTSREDLCGGCASPLGALAWVGPSWTFPADTLVLPLGDARTIAFPAPPVT
jgi:hypothetical protein